MKLSTSQEEYLKAIYLLSNTNNEVRVTDIATLLNITKPSVTKALKVLVELDLINYRSYGDISLTNNGLELAKNILKKYDIVKIFLKEILEVNDKNLDSDAANIKSVISQETLDKLEKYIISTLKLSDLKCTCDMNNERCRKCIKITKSKKEQIKC